MKNQSTGMNALSLSAKAQRTHEAPISYLIATAMANPRLVNFAAGLVDPLTLPVEECAQITQKLFADPDRGRIALQYDTTQGMAALRALAAEHLGRLEGKAPASFGVSADDILVTTGSQQSLYLIADALLDPGDIVIAAGPSYFVFTGTLGSFGVHILTVPMDEHGMDVEAVDRLLARLQRDGRLDRVKLIYCTSYYQNPTGLTLSADRRPRLVEIAKKYSQDHRLLILEDAAYRELRYDGPVLPSIKSFDPDNRYTIIAQTFSKPFAPGIKTGYSAMPADLLEPVAHQKGNHDFGSANLSQHIAAEALRDGSYYRHVGVLCDAYRKKRDRMLESLDRHMPKADGLRWTRPNGGLYVWLTLPLTVDTSRSGPMFPRAVERGVLYVPGDYCFQPGVGGEIAKNHLRLSFGQVTIEQIEPGIEMLSRVVADQLSNARSAATTIPPTGVRGATP